MTDLQHNIKFLRQYRGLTQAQLGQQIGVSEDLVGSYEKRGTKPKLPVLDKIANVFEVTTEILLSEKLSAESYERYLNSNDAAEDNLSIVKEHADEYGSSIYNLIKQQNNLIKVLTEQSRAITQQSETSNRILGRMADNVETKISTIDISLGDALGRIESLKFDVSSSVQVALESLARLEKKKPGSLLKEADNIKLEMLNELKRQSKSAGKGM